MSSRNKLKSRPEQYSKNVSVRSHNLKVKNSDKNKNSELHSPTVFKKLIENAAEAVLIVNNTGNIVFLNKIAEKRFKFKRQELLGKPFEFLIPQRFREIHHEHWADYITKPENRSLNADMKIFALRKDGSEFPVEIGLNFVKSNGHILIMCIIVDITERKMLDDALKKSEEKYRTLFEQSKDAIYITTVDGNIVEANQAFLNLFGYSNREIEKLNVKKLYVDKSERIRFQNEIEKHGSIKDFEVKLFTKAGRELVVNLSSTVKINHEGKITGYQGIIRDVTESKCAEEVLHNIAIGVSGATGEAFFRSLVQFLATDLNLDYAFIGEIVGDEADAVNTLSVYARGKIVENFEYQLKNTPCENVISKRLTTYPKGVQKIFPNDHLLKQLNVDSYIGTPLFDGGGHPLGIMAVMHSKPISNTNFAKSILQIFAVRATAELERIHAEEALRDSEDRYRHLLETVTDYIYTVKVKNGQEIETMHGPGCIAVTGYKPQDYQADPNLWYNMVHAEDREAVMKHIANLLSKDEVSPLEHRIIHKDSSVRWVKNTPVPRFDEQGNLIAYDGLISEITERKRAEEALRESEEKYRLVVQNNNEAILVVQDGLIKFFNPKALEFTGFKKMELNSKPILDLCFPEDQNILLNLLGKFTSEEPLTSTNSIRIIDKQGKIKWMEISSIFITWNGSPAHLCFLNNITERKFLQEELERAQRLEAAGRVAGQIAHDFNNLLSPLTAYPGLIREEIHDNTKVVEMLEEMQDSAYKIAEINQQLLALGRRGHYTMEAVDLNDLVHKVVMSGGLPKDIRIKEQFASDLLMIKGGTAQLTRALNNLIINANEAMNGIGALTIKTQNRYLEKPLRGYPNIRKGEYVELQISDTGCGIKTDILDKIFDPFFTTKKMDRSRGSGLGLSVVHGIIEDHQGYLLVDTKLNQSTTFSIFLPVTREIEKEMEKVVETSKGGNEKILIVDDDPIQRKVASQLLKRLGYKVRTVQSGESAVNHLKKQSYDILLLDMIMNGMDGVETYRQILESKPEQKAIILSGYAMSTKVEEALKLGAGSFVTKPITQKILANVVRKELDRKKRKKRRVSFS